MDNRTATWTVGLLLFASSCLSQLTWQQSWQATKTEVTKAERFLAEPLIPSATALKAVSLGKANQQALSDLIWLQLIQYFGQGNPYGKWPSLGKLLDTSTQLDPKSRYPYQFGLIVLPFMEQVPQAQILAQRANQELPDDALLQFYIGSLYQLNIKDYEKAAYHYGRSADLGGPGASRSLQGVSLAQLSGSLDERRAAITFWQTVYQESQNDIEKDRAKNWIAHLSIVLNIEQEAETFKQKNGRYPLDLAELQRAGQIPENVTSPINRQLILSPETGRVDFTQFAS